MLHLILQFLSTLEFSTLCFTDRSKYFIKKFGKHDEALFQLHRVLWHGIFLWLGDILWEYIVFIITVCNLFKICALLK